MEQRTKIRAYCAVSFVNVLWGLSFIASKHALQNGFQPFSLAAVRFAVASVILLPLLAKREGLRLRKRDFPLMLLSALFGMTIYFLFEYEGLERTSASTASLIIAAIPALTLLCGVVIHRRRYRPIAYLGVVTSLFGVFLIVRQSGGADSLVGNLFILGACLCWVAYIETTDALMRRCSSLYVTTWQCALGAITLIPCALTERLDWAAVTPTSWGMALYLAVMCSVVGYLLYVDTISKLDPFTTALFININPIAAVLGGVLLLGETLAPLQVLGGVIVLVSIFLVNRQPAKTAASPTSDVD